MDSRTWQTQAGNRSVLNAPRVRAAAAAALLLAAPAFGAAPGDADAPAANTPILHLATESPAPAAGVSEGVPQETPAPTRVSAGQDGFAIESGNGDFRLQIGLLLHADGRFAIDDDDERVTDTFALKRVRPYLRGRFSRRFEFFLNPDFAGGTLVVQDAYVDTVFTQAFRIRAGKAKTPFGLERLQSASGMLFFNRAFPTSLAPNRDLGIQLLGDIRSGLVSYAVGVLNGVADGGSADVDTGDSKDVAGRVVVRPFHPLAASRLKGLGLAFSASAGRQAGGALPTFRTSLLEQPFFSYSGASVNGVRRRYSPQVFYYFRSLGGYAEWVHTGTPVRRDAIREEIAHDAWQVAASYVLTGETATESGVRPRSEFGFGTGGFGAFQVAARYHALKVDPRAVASGLAAPGATPRADAWTVGLNWYLTRNVRHTFNVERTTFDDSGAGTSRRAENAFVFRTQVNF